MLRNLLTGAVLVAAVLTPLTMSAQDDKLSVHGSINLGYAKTDGLPYFGANKDGTSDYRSVTLQVGYKISDKDRVVIQLLARKLGTSPLNAVTPDVQPVWAFYEHKFDNGVGLKVGRNPLPRGLFNEIRYIGTLLPLYRVGGTGVYGETFESLDGAVVSKTFNLGRDWALQSSAFGGGFDIKANFTTATGITTVNSRQESTVGTQLFLQTPIRGVKVGGFLSSFQSTPASSLPVATRPKRTSQQLYSADANFDWIFARAEFSRTSAPAPRFLDVRSWYVQTGVKPHDKVTIAAEYGVQDNHLRPAAPVTNEVTLPASRDAILGVSWQPSPQYAFKLEGHRYNGYSFDTSVPSVIRPTKAPFIATLAPANQVHMMIASVAVSF